MYVLHGLCILYNTYQVKESVTFNQKVFQNIISVFESCYFFGECLIAQSRMVLAREKMIRFAFIGETQIISLNCKIIEERFLRAIAITMIKSSVFVVVWWVLTIKRIAHKVVLYIFVCHNYKLSKVSLNNFSHLGLSEIG